MALFVPPKLSAFYRPRAMSRQMTMSLTNKGLLNPTGENNCFLNSTVQVLWHLDVFRRSFRRFEGHCCIGKSCIFCALKVLFTQIQHSDQSALPPDILRNAMADCYQEQHRFQLGLMDDAAECFEKILEQIHLHVTGSEDMDTCSANFCLPHQKFALNILERTECTCGATSEPLAFVQFVHYISSSALVAEYKKVKGVRSGTVGGGGGALFSMMIKMASAVGEYRECPNYAQCKQTVSVRRILLNCPDVVCLGLIWDSDQPPVDYIMNVTHSIGLSLYLSDAFDHVLTDSARANQYDLTAVVAYYGRHYSTFCYHSVLKEWIYFDDAKFRKIGRDWSDVVGLIHKAHYQPLLLVYANHFADPVDTSGAPVDVKMMSFGKSRNNGSMPALDEEEEEEMGRELQTDQNAAEVGKDGQLTNRIEFKAGTTNQIAANTTSQPTVSATQPLLTHEAIDPLMLSIMPTSRLPPQLPGKAAVAVQGGGRVPSSGVPGAVGGGRLAVNRPSNQPGQSARGDGSTRSEDLMMFSVTPQAAQNAREAMRRQVSPQLAPEKADNKSAALMATSVPPVQSRNTARPPHQAREQVILSNVGAQLLPGQPIPEDGTSPHKGSAKRNLSQQNHVSTSEGSRTVSRERVNQFVSQDVPADNREMLAEDLIEFSISPVAFSKVSTKYGDGGRQGQPLKQQNYKTYGSGPSSEPSRTPASVPPMKYSPLAHLAKSDLPPQVQPISIQSTASQPRPQQQPGSSSGSYPYPSAHVSPPPSERFPAHPTTTLNQFPSYPMTTSTGAGEIAQRPRPYGNWEHFEGGSTSASKSRTSPVPARERELSDFRRSAPPQPQSSPSEPQRSRFMSPPPTHTHQRTVSPSTGSDPSYTTPTRTQKSQTLPSVSHQSSRPCTTPASGHVSPPLVATGYSQHLPPSASSRDGQGFKSPVNLSRRGLTASPPVGRVPLPVQGTHNVHQDRPKRQSSPTTGTDRKYPRLYPDPFYSTADQVPSSQGEIEGSDRLHPNASVARQTGHTPDTDRTQSSATGKLVTVPSPPITGDDPLYAVPSKVMQKSQVPQPMTQPAATSGGGGRGRGGGRREERERGATMSLGTPAIMAIPESTRTELVDAMDKWAMAEASRGDDDTVALMLYSQAAGMLGKVLHDAAVVSNPELRQQINGRREDMMRKCAELKPHPLPERERVSCIRCGRVRSVNDFLLCGPCALRVKMGKQ